MPRLPIDTHALIQRLQEVGVPLSQAEAQVGVLMEMVASQELASQTDIRKLRFLIKRDSLRYHKELLETQA